MFSSCMCVIILINTNKGYIGDEIYVDPDYKESKILKSSLDLVVLANSRKIINF